MFRKYYNYSNSMMVEKDNDLLVPMITSALQYTFAIFAYIT